MLNKLCAAYLLLRELKMTLMRWRAQKRGWDEAAGISLKTLIQEAALCQQDCVTDCATAKKSYYELD